MRNPSQNLLFLDTSSIIIPSNKFQFPKISYKNPFNFQFPKFSSLLYSKLSSRKLLSQLIPQLINRNIFSRSGKNNLINCTHPRRNRSQHPPVAREGSDNGVHWLPDAGRNP